MEITENSRNSFTRNLKSPFKKLNMSFNRRSYREDHREDKQNLLDYSNIKYFARRIETTIEIRIIHNDTQNEIVTLKEREYRFLDPVEITANRTKGDWGITEDYYVKTYKMSHQDFIDKMIYEKWNETPGPVDEWFPDALP